MSEGGAAVPATQQLGSTISVGAACSNACVFCAVHDGEIDAGARLRALRASGASAVTFSGGEPTLVPDRLLDAVRDAKALGFASIGLSTNGHALAPIARGLREAGLTHVHLSVHGADARVHDYHTAREGSFEALWAAAAAARAASLRVIATTVLTRSNFRVLAETPVLLAARGIAAWRIAVPVARGRAQDDFDRVMPRLALALPFANHALEIARRTSLPAYVSGAPLCLLGPFAARAIASPPGEPRGLHARCEGCAARDACPGVDATYLARFDGDELRPREDRPPSADREPLAALFPGVGELAPLRDRVVHEPSQSSRRALPVLGRPKRAVKEAASRSAKTGEALREILPALFEERAGSEPTEES